MIEGISDSLILKGAVFFANSWEHIYRIFIEHDRIRSLSLEKQERLILLLDEIKRSDTQSLGNAVVAYALVIALSLSSSDVAQSYLATLSIPNLEWFNEIKNAAQQRRKSPTVVSISIPRESYSRLSVRSSLDSSLIVKTKSFPSPKLTEVTR